MGDRHEKPHLPHLVWVFPGSLTEVLDSATWLETTRELRKLGWRVTLVNAGPSGWQSIQGVETFNISQPDMYFAGKFIFHIKLLFFLIKWWAEIELIMFHQISAPWILPLRIFRSLTTKNKPRLIMDTRTLPMSLKTWKARARGTFENLMNQLANRWADGQTTITWRMAQVVHVPPQQLLGTWPSGVNPEQFKPAQLARQWPLPGMPICLIYVGVLHHERNLIALCHAVEAANRQGVSFKLAIVGDGGERANLEVYARQTKGRIRILAPVPHEQVPTLLAQSHVGVLPFRDEECFRVSSPIKLFEYMAAGLPILATRIACHTDVASEGEYIFWSEGDSVADLNLALMQVWKNQASLSKMGSEAAAAAKSWTWQASAMKLDDALKKGLEKSWNSSYGGVLE